MVVPIFRGVLHVGRRPAFTKIYCLAREGAGDGGLDHGIVSIMQIVT